MEPIGAQRSTAPGSAARGGVGRRAAVLCPHARRRGGVAATNIAVVTTIAIVAVMTMAMLG